jgi:hypothetical protein
LVSIKVPPTLLATCAFIEWEGAMNVTGGVRADSSRGGVPDALGAELRDSLAQVVAARLFEMEGDRRERSATEPEACQRIKREALEVIRKLTEAAAREPELLQGLPVVVARRG